jgi:hypothetical protein
MRVAGLSGVCGICDVFTVPVVREVGTPWIPVLCFSGDTGAKLGGLSH